MVNFFASLNTESNCGIFVLIFIGKSDLFGYSYNFTGTLIAVKILFSILVHNEFTFRNLTEDMSLFHQLTGYYSLEGVKKLITSVKSAKLSQFLV